MLRFKHLLAISLLAVSLQQPLWAAVERQALPYTNAQGQSFDGQLVWDMDKLKRSGNPAVIVFHAWMGPTDHEQDWAERLAKQGYVVLIADVYGAGVRPSTPALAAQESGKYRENRTLMRERAQLALQQLQSHKLVNPERIGAIVFCFGGTVALELARSGAPLAATVSLHGGLSTPNREDAKAIQGPVLVLHGGDDPYVPSAEVGAFQAEMREAGVDWQFNSYGGAVHAFTDAKAGNNPASGAAYHAESARRAWWDMSTALCEWLKAR